MIRPTLTGKTQLHTGLIPTLTNTLGTLREIPEDERRRLSHASRLRLEAAEAELRGLLKTIAGRGE